jgi:hypothetical protein
MAGSSSLNVEEMITKGKVKKFVNKAYDDDKKASTSISSSRPTASSSQSSKPRWWQKCDASVTTAENVPMDVNKMTKRMNQRPAAR